MRNTLCGVLLCGCAASAAAEGTPVTFEEPQPVAVTGFAVGRADYDRLARSNSFTAGKIGVSLFKPVGEAYLFAQLTTTLEDGETSTEIDNLLVSWTPQRANRWTVAFGRFDAPIGFERDDEPLNLIATNSFNFAYARPGKLTGVQLHYTVTPRFELWGVAANGWDVAARWCGGGVPAPHAQPRVHRPIRSTGRLGRPPHRHAPDPAIRHRGPDVVLLARERGDLQQHRAPPLPPAADRTAGRRPRGLVVPAVLHGCERRAARGEHPRHTRARVHLLGGGIPCCTTCGTRTPGSSGS